MLRSARIAVLSALAPAAVLAGALVAPARAAAQDDAHRDAHRDAQPARSAPPRPAPFRELRPSLLLEPAGAFTAAISAERSWLALSAAGALARGEANALEGAGASDAWRGYGVLSATLMSPAVLGFRLSAGVTDLATSRAAWWHERRTTGARLSFADAGTWGAWLGMERRTSNARDALPAETRPTLGVWRRLGGMLLAVRVSDHAVRVGGRGSRTWATAVRDSFYSDTSGWQYFERQIDRVDSGAAGVRARWTEAEATASWGAGRLALDARIGGRPDVRTDGVRGAAWGALDATYALGPRAALVASAGVRPSSPEVVAPGGRFLRIGARLSPRASAPSPVRPHRAPEIRPGAASLDLRRLEDGRYVISVRAPRARIVEVSADFTSWEPVALERVTADRWETTVSLAPGAYRINVRVDGERWLAPPGTAEVDDSFGGTAGLVVAR